MSFFFFLILVKITVFLFVKAENAAPNDKIQEIIVRRKNDLISISNEYMMSTWMHGIIL